MRFDPLIGHQKLLGSDFVNALMAPKFRSGRLGISRHQLVREYGTGNFLAANNVLKACAAMQVTIMDLFRMPIREVAEIKGIGVTGVYVLLCIGHKRNVDIDAWLKGTEVGYATLKRNAHEKDSDNTTKRSLKTAKDKRHAALHGAGTHVLKTRTTKSKLAKAS